MFEKIFKNKKGAEKYFSLWDLFMFVIIGTGIVISVYIFSSANLDTREIEAEILNNKIYDCVVENGVIIPEFFDLDFDIYEKCGLSKKIFKLDNKFFFKIEFYDNSGGFLREPIKSFIDKSVECDIQKNSEAEHLMKCYEKNTDVLFFKKNKLVRGSLKILTSSNNELENKNA